MPSPEPFLIFIRKLRDLRLRYMIGGSVAAIFYGEPRLTNDVDVILFIGPDVSGPLAAAFSSDQFYCPPEEVIRLEIAARRSA